MKSLNNEITTKSEKETFNLGKKFAKRLKGGEAIGLIGDLGSGKTVFVKGLAVGLGIKKHITSPTFVIMKDYKAKNDKVKRVAHLDAYRLGGLGDLEAIGVNDFLEDQSCVTIIEWADKVKEISFDILIKFKIKGEEREITFLYV